MFESLQRLMPLKTFCLRLVEASYLYVAAAIALLSLRPWPDDLGVLYFPFFVVPIHALSAAHGYFEFVRPRSPTVARESLHEYYSCFLGILYGFGSFALSTIIIGLDWDKFDATYHALLVCNISLASLWLLCWAYLGAKRCRKRELDAQQRVSCLLLLRCACVPSEARRALLVAPSLVFGLLGFMDGLVYRNENCIVPLADFLLISGITMLLAAAFLLRLFGFSRQLKAFQDTSEEISLLQPKQTGGEQQIRRYGQLSDFSLQVFLGNVNGTSLTLRFVNIFGIVWAIIGWRWVLVAQDQCPWKYVGVTKLHCIVLMFSCASTLFFSTCCKLESCFPSRLDPACFEGEGLELGGGDALPRPRPLSSHADASRVARWLKIVQKVLGTIMAFPEWYEMDDPGSPHRK